jgi:tetratricopeptide (TPR) repeat protein
MKRFPELPSNYFWLARVDFDNLDLLNTLRDYDKAAEIVERSPKEVGQSFYSQFINATQAAIDAGQYDQALRFVNIAEKYGLQDYERRGLLCQILIAKSDALAIPELKKTDMWSEEISNYNQQNLKNVNQIASEMSWYKAYKTGRLITGVYKPDLLFSAALGSGDYSKAKELADSAAHSAPRSRQLATVALAQNDPQLALNLISRWCGPKSDYADKYEYIRAEALLRLHRASEAMSVVDEVLTSSDYGDTVTKAKFYLPFRIIKAKALYDIGKYQEALAEANKILAINPHLIRARLIKIDTLNKLNDASGAAREQAATVAELQLALTQSGNVTGATHDR